MMFHKEITHKTVSKGSLKRQAVLAAKQAEKAKYTEKVKQEVKLNDMANKKKRKKHRSPSSMKHKKLAVMKMQ